MSACRRDLFEIPRDRDGREKAYLCGHSLGLRPKRAATLVEEELDRWGKLGVEGHFEGERAWVDYHALLTDKLARLVGARPSEVVAMNGLTVNLHLLFASLYRPTRDRHKVLIESPAFPSDRYAVVSQIEHHGLDPRESLVEVGPRTGESHVREADLEEILEREGERLALVWLSGVSYASGQAFDMARIVALGHRVGALVGLDLAHAVGNLELALHDWSADFAVWCHYKYVNGGPGAVGGAFVHERHAGAPRFAGWWGHERRTRFAMGPEFRPAPGTEGFQLSNPPILALAPVLASLEIFDEVGMAALRQRSRELTGRLARLVEEEVEILTPESRGAMLSLRVRGGKGREVFERLGARGVVCDWREPDIIRAAPAPLYNDVEDVERFAEALRLARG